MDLRALVPATLTLLLLATACATLAPDREPPATVGDGPATAEATDPATAPPMAPPVPTVRIHVDGPGTEPGSCSIRVYALHGPEVEPHVVYRTLELFRRSDDLFVGSLEGASQIPYEEAVETFDGLESPITGEDLTMDCGEVRAVLRIERCEPSPCPAYEALEGYNLIPVEVTTAGSE